MAEGIEAQTDQALRNIAAILHAAGASMANPVKTTIFYADVVDFGPSCGRYEARRGRRCRSRTTGSNKTRRRPLGLPCDLHLGQEACCGATQVDMCADISEPGPNGGICADDLSGCASFEP